MRTNRTKAKLLRGEVVVGCALTYPDPELVELIGAAGFDFVRFEGEHGPLDLVALEHLVRAAELWELTPGARVPDAGHLLRYLDRGVSALTVPHVETRAEAEAAVRAAKHHPLGARGHNAGGRPSRYGFEQRPPREYYNHLNAETLLIALIETEEGLRNAAAIAATPGIDMIDVGPSDLAQSLGLPGDAAVWEAVETIVAAAVAAGKPVGVGQTMTPAALRDPDTLRRWVERGSRYFLCQANDLFKTAAADALAVIEPLRALARP